MKKKIIVAKEDAEAIITAINAGELRSARAIGARAVRVAGLTRVLPDRPRSTDRIDPGNKSIPNIKPSGKSSTKSPTLAEGKVVIYRSPDTFVVTLEGDRELIAKLSEHITVNNLSLLIGERVVVSVSEDEANGVIIARGTLHDYLRPDSSTYLG